MSASLTRTSNHTVSSALPLHVANSWFAMSKECMLTRSSLVPLPLFFLCRMWLKSTSVRHRQVYKSCNTCSTTSNLLSLLKSSNGAPHLCWGIKRSEIGDLVGEGDERWKKWKRGRKCGGEIKSEVCLSLHALKHLPKSCCCLSLFTISSIKLFLIFFSFSTQITS